MIWPKASNCGSASQTASTEGLVPGPVMLSGWPKLSPAFPGKMLVLQLFCSASCWHRAHAMPKDSTMAKKKAKLKSPEPTSKYLLLVSSECPPCFKNHLSQEALRSLQSSSRTAGCSNHSICTSLCAGSKEARYKCKWGCLLWQRRLTASNV